MKQSKIVLSVILLASLAFTSCQNMLYVESDRYLYADNNKLDSPSDSVYSLAGILTKWQLLGDQYVLLGELRGELMDVTENADQDLIDLSNLDYSNPDNEFLAPTNYYAVINHCNYLIANMDTTILVAGETRLKREYVAATAIRAWTYMQLAFNFNGAYYYDEPILTVAQSKAIANDPQYFLDREAILNELEADLLPWYTYPMPEYIGLGSSKVSDLIPSVAYMLGEIYLWQNRYAEAANMYFYDINEKERVVSSLYRSSYIEGNYSTSASSLMSNSITSDGKYFMQNYWGNQFGARPGITPEISAGIPYYSTNTFGKFNVSKMYKYCYIDYKLAPSQYAYEWFNSQPYLDKTKNASTGVSSNVATTGDLRGVPGSIAYTTTNYEQMDKSDISTTEMQRYEQIAIYQAPVGSLVVALYTNYSFSPSIILQRSTLAYLRYAEALNRMGKPTTALAVVNNGLKVSTLRDSTLIATNEMDSVFTEQFNKEFYVSNVGTRTRGQGPSTSVEFFFTKDASELTLQDSILYVEQVLVDECGLETAFNGNRFHDLLRFTQHEGAPNYIATALAGKFPDRASEFAAKAFNDWFIPYPKATANEE